MKKHIFIFTALAVLLSLGGCEKHSDEMTSSYPTDGDIEYGLGKVLQYDPQNINGINVVSKFDFFNTLKLTIHIQDSKIIALTYDNGNIPFSPYDFQVPEGRFECDFDTDILPNELRIKGTNHVIAYYIKGEFVVPFQLDSKSLNYEYKFKNFENQ